MQISSVNEGLGCQSVYRVLGVLDGDINFYIQNLDFEREYFDFEGVITGSAALAIHADRHGMNYDTETKDVDIYTNSELADLKTIERFPHGSRSRENGSQYRYDTSTAATQTQVDAFVDIITDYEEAFEWEEDEAREVEQLLEEETSGKPIAHGTTEIYLPSLKTLKKTFQYSNRDYTQRTQMIEKMQ